jgi:hypothetical protein
MCRHDLILLCSNDREEEKEADASDGKPPSVKLLLDAKGTVEKLWCRGKAMVWINNEAYRLPYMY